MRRRAADFRRPLRRRFPNALWWVLCGVAVLLFIFTFSGGNQMESRPVIPTIHIAFCGDAISFLNQYIPGVMNPHTKAVRQWNKFFVIACLVAIFLDPLFFFVLYAEQLCRFSSSQMAAFENDEAPMLATKSSDEHADSKFQKFESISLNVSNSIPVNSQETETNLVDHTSCLQSNIKSPFMHACVPFQQFRMCNDPYCTICSTCQSLKYAKQDNPKGSRLFDPKIHIAFYGDAISFLNQYIPGVMNPHTKAVRQWNKFCHSLFGGNFSRPFVFLRVICRTGWLMWLLSLE